MASREIIVALALSLIVGCAQPTFVARMPRMMRMSRKMAKATQVVNAPAPFQQFVATNFDWPSVRRIVLMPLANQTAYPHVIDEMRDNLAAEIQRAGRFEIVVATYDDPGARSHDVFANGQFNELDVLRVAREYSADAVLFANVTQYHPYSPPRIGISLLLVSPAEGVAIASLSGLWDAREANTAAHAQTYFKQTQNWSRSLLGSERVIESPDVFQRYVCQQVSVALYPSAAGATDVTGGQMGFPMRPDGMMPTDEQYPVGGDPPAVPPSAQDIEQMSARIPNRPPGR